MTFCTRSVLGGCSGLGIDSPATGTKNADDSVSSFGCPKTALDQERF